MLDTLDRMITPPRVKAAALLVLGVYVATSIAWLLSLHGLIDGFGQPLGGDFVIFYAASRLALHGHLLQAFDPHLLLLAERAAVPGVKPGLEWCYPPTFALLTLPLALLPFPAAYAAWVAATAAPYFAMVRKIAGSPWALLFAAAFPGAFVNAWQGQTGFLVAALLGYGLVLLDARPWLAGAALGLLVIKPQFGLLLPLLLIGTGRYRSALAAALSALAFVAVSAAVFGIGPWLAFVRNAPEVSRGLTEGLLPWSKIPTVFVALAWLGAPKELAYAAQALVGVAVALVTLAAWRRPGPLPLKAGLAVLATLIALPYAFNYDLVLLAIPIAAVADHARRHPLPSGTKAALALAAFTPNIFLGLAKATHVQLMPVAILLCYVALYRTLRSVEPRVGTAPGQFEVTPA